MLAGMTGGSLNHVESINLHDNLVGTGGVHLGESITVFCHCRLFCAIYQILAGWVVETSNAITNALCIDVQ